MKTLVKFLKENSSNQISPLSPEEIPSWLESNLKKLAYIFAVPPKMSVTKHPSKNLYMVNFNLKYQFEEKNFVELSKLPYFSGVGTKYGSIDSSDVEKIVRRGKESVQGLVKNSYENILRSRAIPVQVNFKK
jgi:hypothetical protein